MEASYRSPLTLIVNYLDSTLKIFFISLNSRMFSTNLVETTQVESKKKMLKTDTRATDGRPTKDEREVYLS